MSKEPQGQSSFTPQKPNKTHPNILSPIPIKLNKKLNFDCVPLILQSNNSSTGVDSFLNFDENQKVHRKSHSFSEIFMNYSQSFIKDGGQRSSNVSIFSGYLNNGSNVMPFDEVYSRASNPIIFDEKFLDDKLSECNSYELNISDDLEIIENDQNKEDFDQYQPYFKQNQHTLRQQELQQIQ